MIHLYVALSGIESERILLCDLEPNKYDEELLKCKYYKHSSKSIFYYKTKNLYLNFFQYFYQIFVLSFVFFHLIHGQNNPSLTLVAKK